MGLLRIAAVLLGLAVIAAPAAAQAPYPDRPIRLIVPFGAGGPTDVIARLISQKLSELWGKQVYVENMPGAGGNTGTAAAAKATPDGYTFLTVSTGFIINPSLYARVPYDPLKNFQAVSLVAVSPNVLTVNPTVPAKSVKELIELIRANPGKYSYAQPSTGSTPHLAGEMFKLTYSLDLATVAHTSAAAAITSTMGGHTPVAFTALPGAMPGIQGGKLRALAVLSAKRVPGLPDVPTMAEAGIPDQESDTLTAIVTPIGTPRELVDLWSREIQKIVAAPEATKHLQDLGFQPVASTPDAFTERIKSESAKWDRIVKQAKVRIE